MNNDQGSRERKFADHNEDDSPLYGPITNSMSDLSLIPDARDKLCTRCADINFDDILQRICPDYMGSCIMRLATSIRDMMVSDCPLYHLFASMSPSGSTGLPALYLSIFSAEKAFATYKPWNRSDIKDTTLLGVVRRKHHNEPIRRDELQVTGYLCPVTTNKMSASFGVRLIHPNSFDIALVQGWFNYCQRKHAMVCSSGSRESLISLRVTDCESRTIVMAPADCQYIALSYVWASPTSHPSTEVVDANPEIVPKLVPKVVEDSMNVTTKLGLRYLWVDKYCIIQSDNHDKHRQIRQMDSIYANAQLTVIAATGQISSRGLPGVRGTLREHQQFLRIGDQVLASIMATANYLMNKSKWATRAWTYQEGLLSRRRLIFTDQQVFWECNGMHCSESVIMPLDAMHTNDKRRFKEDIPCGALRYKAPSSKSWDFMEYVCEYVKRQMTYETDALHAMQGVFRVFENAPQQVYQLRGVPILPNSRDIKSYGPTPMTSVEGLLHGLLWRYWEPRERRPHFPSWSWAGWRRGCLDGTPRDLHFKPWDLKIWIEDIDGQLLMLPDFHALPEFFSRADRHTIFIHIEAWTVDVVCVRTSKESCRYRFAIDQESFAFTERMLSQRITCDVESGLGPSSNSLTIIFTAEYVEETHCSWLLVEDRGDHFEWVNLIRNGFVKCKDKRGEWPCLGRAYTNPAQVIKSVAKRRRIRLG